MKLLRKLEPFDRESGGLNVVIDTPKGSMEISVMLVRLPHAASILGGQIRSAVDRKGKRSDC